MSITRDSLLVILFFANFCHAASSVNAIATLSRNRVAAGEVVELDVKVTGAQQADVPPEIAAEGLQIKLTGQSSEVQMINFKVSSSVIYSYIVVPLKSGNLTIPSISVRAEGQMVRTSALQLEVIGTGKSFSNTPSQQVSPMSPVTTRSRLATPSSNSVDRDRLGFAEIVIPKKKFYVGEVVPVEIRFGVDAHYGFSTIGPPNFGSEGVLTDRFKDPERSREERNDVIYNVAIFRTLFAVVKPGVLDIPPATLDIAVAIPEATPPGMDPDLFSRLMGGRSPFVREQKMTLKTNVTHCEVMPLPAEGRPTDFSGAIGEFRLEGSVAPQKVEQGDPVTLSLKLSGKGNFQALKGPRLTETQGWRTYPPAEHFESSDVWGWKGVKTFDTTMIAQQAVGTTPGSSFSYFDPVATKYVTLTTKPLPIEITNATPAATPAPTPIVGKATPAPSSKPTQRERLQQKTQHSWNDLLHQQEWIIAWFSFFFGTIGIICFFLSRAYSQRALSPRDQEKQRLAILIAELEQKELSIAEFYNKAATAAELLLKQGVTEEAGISELEEILRRHEEIEYGARRTFLTPAEKKRLIEELKNHLGSHR